MLTLLAAGLSSANAQSTSSGIQQKIYIIPPAEALKNQSDVMAIQFSDAQNLTLKRGQWGDVSLVYLHATAGMMPLDYKKCQFVVQDIETGKLVTQGWQVSQKGIKFNKAGRYVLKVVYTEPSYNHRVFLAYKNIEVK